MRSLKSGVSFIILTSLFQGLYPGYLIFFVQSALMIAGSRGMHWIAFICFFSILVLIINFPLSPFVLLEQSYTDGSNLLLQQWLMSYHL